MVIGHLNTSIVIGEIIKSNMQWVFFTGRYDPHNYGYHLIKLPLEEIHPDDAFCFEQPEVVWSSWDEEMRRWYEK